MQIGTSSDKPSDSTHDLIVLGVFAGDFAKAPAFKQLDHDLQGALSSAAHDQEFKGKAKQSLVLATLGKLRARRVALVGLGNRDDQTAESFVRLGGTSARLGNGVGAQQVLVVLPEKLSDRFNAHELVARGAHLGAYRFDAYKSEKGKAPSVKKLALHGSQAAAVKEALKRAAIVAESVALARDLVNQPAMDLYPESFAARAQTLARATGLKCTILGPEQLEKRGMNMLLGVGMGSERPPRLVHLSYAPTARGRKPAGKAAALTGGVALIGKGVTFDSGGLCLKPPDSMYGMKVDMAGAAAVLATMLAVAKLGAPEPVHGVLALAENMPSGNAFRPGDILTSAAGKTVEINNTDAEGRLVLGDALHYIGAHKPRCMIDLATLTGACMVALGALTAGLFSNDDDLANGLLAAAKRQGEDFWRMPLTPSLRDQLKSEVADMRNTGERYGGAITAALFLKEFVGSTPWAHLDIAGPATSNEDAGATSKGGTGVAVASLVDFIMTGAGNRRAIG